MTSTALACTVKNYLRVVENLTADLRKYKKYEKYAIATVQTIAGNCAITQEKDQSLRQTNT